jgi:hypothetical protein
VEDDAVQRERMRGWLEGPQWTVREAENGREALNRIQESKPDVILLDLMMPEMDGFAVVTHLGPSNWYIDAVLQGTYFQTAANSIRGVANNFSGRGFAASIEGGYPIVLTSWLTFEPQIQGIWQRLVRQYAGSVLDHLVRPLRRAHRARGRAVAGLWLS